MTERFGQEITALRDFGVDLRLAMERGAIASGPGLSRRARTRVAVALLAIAALTGFAFTPPGRAVAEEIGQLIGIGDTATLPPKDTRGITRTGQPIVIATGTAPDGSRYEVVASHALVEEPQSPRERLADRGRAHTCLTADLVETPAANSAEFCFRRNGYFAAGDIIDGVNYVDRLGEGNGGARAVGPEARYELDAGLSPNIARVDVFYEDESGERVQAYSDVGALDEEIAEQIGTEDRGGYMIAFLPDDGLEPFAGGGFNRGSGVLGTVELIGYDASGREVARENYGASLTRSIGEMVRRRRAQLRIEAEIAAAAQHGELELNRANVKLCEQAGRFVGGSDMCWDVISRAAAKGLYGFSAPPG